MVAIAFIILMSLLFAFVALRVRAAKLVPASEGLLALVLMTALIGIVIRVAAWLWRFCA